MFMNDVAINGGLVFDGTGAAPIAASVAVHDGLVTQMRAEPFSAAEARTRVDARGDWVMPGFLDMHTHYDAEVWPRRRSRESVRHGVTTVVWAAAPSATILSDAARLRRPVHPRRGGAARSRCCRCSREEAWSTPREYVALPRARCRSGPTSRRSSATPICARAVLGLGPRRRLRGAPGRQDELAAMERWLEDGARLRASSGCRP